MTVTMDNAETQVTMTFNFMDGDLAPFMRDIFITACEGGINYWCALERYTHSRPTETGRRPDYDNFRAIVREEDEGQDLLIDRTVIAKGCAILIGDFGTDIKLNNNDRNRIRGILIAAAARPDDADEYAGYLDASDADYIVQIGLFGEVMYG